MLNTAWIIKDWVNKMKITFDFLHCSQKLNYITNVDKEAMITFHSCWLHYRLVQDFGKQFGNVY